MAEFQEVMRHINRMCREERCEENGCPIFEYCGNIGNLGDPVSSSRIEEAVMKWAAEHPEPVYPTWGEWFLRTCQVPVTSDGKNNWDAVHMSHIPADIAQKLGIEPKGGII